MVIIPIITGWWFFATPLKNDGVKVSWDDDIPNIVWKKIIQMFQATNQINMFSVGYISYTCFYRICYNLFFVTVHPWGKPWNAWYRQVITTMWGFLPAEWTMTISHHPWRVQKAHQADKLSKRGCLSSFYFMFYPSMVQTFICCWVNPNSLSFFVRKSLFLLVKSTLMR